MLSADPQYTAATEGVALIDRSDRGKLAVSGPDAAAYLDSLLSNDVAGVAPGGGVDATLLTHKGRMLAEVRVLATEDELLLDCERIGLQALFDALTQFRIGYAAELHKRTLQRGLLSLIGPRADELVGLAPGEVEHAHVATVAGEVPVRAIRTELGLDLLCESERTAELAGALTAAGAVTIEEAVAESVRIEHGRPRFGVEIDETTMPQEAGLHERAVSYSKGCYIGQETVARLYWKGKPNRLLRGLRLSAAGRGRRGAATRRRRGRGARLRHAVSAAGNDRAGARAPGSAAGRGPRGRRRRRERDRGGAPVRGDRIRALMAGAVHIPWYATGFRGDQLQAELERISPLAMRYGATGYVVYRGRDDRYKLLQVLDFDDHGDWERWWNGPEMIDFRTYCQGWFQVPIVYAWNDKVCEGSSPSRAAVAHEH